MNYEEAKEFLLQHYDADYNTLRHYAVLTLTSKDMEITESNIELAFIELANFISGEYYVGLVKFSNN